MVVFPLVSVVTFFFLFPTEKRYITKLRRLSLPSHYKDNRQHERRATGTATPTAIPGDAGQQQRPGRCENRDEDAAADSTG